MKAKDTLYVKLTLSVEEVMAIHGAGKLSSIFMKPATHKLLKSVLKRAAASLQRQGISRDVADRVTQI
jgi:hypothetical protein